MKKVIQPYESHLQYLLQWMCDYNLYGCAYINCSRVNFRSPVPDYLNIDSAIHHWHDRTIPSDLITDNETILRQSHCSIEVDVCVQYILNRLEVKSRPIHHDFVERKNPVATDEKLVQSMAGLWRDETRRRKARMGEIEPGSSPFPPDVLVSVSADPRNTQVGGWIHEKEYLEKIKLVVRDERQKGDGRRIEFDGFVENQELDYQVKTSLESVEDLFPENLARAVLSRLASQAAAENAQEAAVDMPQVDETRLLSFEEDAFPYESDEELARERETSQKKQGNRVAINIQQRANQGINGQMDNNVERLAEGLTTTSATEVPRSASVAKVQDVTSSSELEKMGIRNLGHNNADEDAFEVPLDYASYISDERSRGSTEEQLHENKRRKLTNGDLFQTVGVPDYPSQNSSRESHGDSPKAASHLQDKSDLDNSAIVSSGGLGGMPHPHEVNLGKRKFQLSLEGANAVPANNTLSFPIVKDPYDPNTVRKLSQTSTSDVKGSQKSRTMSVSFAPSSEPNPSALNAAKVESMQSSTPLRKLSFQVSQCSSKFLQAFEIEMRKKTLLFAYEPPRASEILLELRNERLPSIIYHDAHYSNEKDVPERVREYAGKEFKLESETVPFLATFDPTGTSSASRGEKIRIVTDKANEERLSRRLRTWEIGEFPPTKT